jgi:ribosome-binding ATPase YchF (GTP1/OBG family)
LMKMDTEADSLQDLMIMSMASMTYLYPSFRKKLFDARMMPLMDILIDLTRLMTRETIVVLNSEQKFENEEFSQLLTLFLQLISQHLPIKASFEDVLKEIDKQKLNQSLALSIASIRNSPSSWENKDLIINLFRQPQDLYELSSKARVCEICHNLENDLTVCLYCGLKCC